MLKLRYILSFALLGIFAMLPVAAQDATPEVLASDQIVTGDTVTIDSVTSEGAGWLVVHADNGEGAPGPVIGFTRVADGTNEQVTVQLDIVNVTPTLFAMLHTDDGEMGSYEFGSVEGADAPVAVDGTVVTTPLGVGVVTARDQFVDPDNFNQVTVDVASLPDDGWVVVHADNGEGAPGPVLGQTFVEAGTTLDVPVILSGDVTDTLYPMLHVDTGEAEQYEFGTVEGADAPFALDDTVAVTSFATVPTLRISNQVVVGSDATRSDSETAIVFVDSVLSEGAGWLVIHADNGEGAPGEVIGFAPVSDGYNADVQVEVTAADVTDTLYPMLHTDTGVESVYEFGEVEGADAPVTVNDEVVVDAMIATPFITYSGTLEEDTLTIANALIDRAGWLVIHADNGEGAPGEVIGFAAISAGETSDIPVTIDTDALTDTVFPMLHYDTGTFGSYEFGEVEGADGPVVVNGDVVTGPLSLSEE